MFSVISLVIVALGSVLVASFTFGFIFGRSADYYCPDLHLCIDGPRGFQVQDADGRKLTTTMRFFVEERCPSLFREFRPARWLFRYGQSSICDSLLNPEPFASGHLQTAYTVIGDFSKIDKVEYDR